LSHAVLPDYAVFDFYQEKFCWKEKAVKFAAAIKTKKLHYEQS